MSVLFRIKHVEINKEKLIERLQILIRKYKRKNICLYVNWLASELGIPKIALTSFLLDNQDVFVLKVGEKSKQLILKEVVKEEGLPLDDKQKEGEKDVKT